MADNNNFLKQLNLTPILTEPKVWISRVVIYKDITPDNAEIIREVKLSRGLNIIWAEESLEENINEVTGHSAGKTTFCRLLRYILGETNFGRKSTVEQISQLFPDGYVAAELHINGKQWAVCRPFGRGRQSYIKENTAIEEFLTKRPTGAVSQADYPEKLGLTQFVDDLPTSKIAQTGEDIKWDHLLAWCSRDQETRFQNIYDWRSPRSDASTPAFQFPKAGPLFVMRCALGLFAPNELKGEEDLAALERQRDTLEKEIEKKKREPEFWHKHYDRELRSLLGEYFPSNPDIRTLPYQGNGIFNDLDRLSAKTIEELNTALENDNKELITTQNEIDQINAEINSKKSEIAQLSG